MPAGLGSGASDERNYDIFRVNADGTSLIDLTPTLDLTENYPVWSPDGSAIAYVASDVLTGDNTGTYDLYTMTPDGTEIRKLTRMPSSESSSTSRRRGRRCLRPHSGSLAM